MIQTTGLSKSFNGAEVLKSIDLHVAPKEIVVLLGPSGSGKSTLLRCLNGLEELDGGSLEVNGVRVDASMPSKKKQAAFREIRRHTGMVFQQFNLYPHKTALGNVIESLLSVKKMKKKKPYRSANDCWIGLDCWRRRMNIPRGCPAASSSGWQLPEH